MTAEFAGPGVVDGGIRWSNERCGRRTEVLQSTLWTADKIGPMYVVEVRKILVQFFLEKSFFLPLFLDIFCSNPWPYAYNFVPHLHAKFKKN